VSRHVPVHLAPGRMHRVSSGLFYSAGANLSRVAGFPFDLASPWFASVSSSEPRRNQAAFIDILTRRSNETN